MARLVFGMNVSLDGYVDYQKFAPGPVLFQHWIDVVRSLAGSIYGRRLYEIMRYWDEDDPGWSDDERAFATAWRSQPKWVVSGTLTSVGPNATLISAEAEAAIRKLKEELSGELDIGGPVLAGSFADSGLIDEYRLYYHPVVLGQCEPFFTGPRPPLRLLSSDRIGEDVVRLTFLPA